MHFQQEDTLYNICGESNMEIWIEGVGFVDYYLDFMRKESKKVEIGAWSRILDGASSEFSIEGKLMSLDPNTIDMKI